MAQVLEQSVVWLARVQAALAHYRTATQYKVLYALEEDAAQFDELRNYVESAILAEQRANQYDSTLIYANGYTKARHQLRRMHLELGEATARPLSGFARASEATAGLATAPSNAAGSPRQALGSDDSLDETAVAGILPATPPLPFVGWRPPPRLAAESLPLPAEESLDRTEPLGEVAPVGEALPFGDVEQWAQRLGERDHRALCTYASAVRARGQVGEQASGVSDPQAAAYWDERFEQDPELRRYFELLLLDPHAFLRAKG